MKPPLIDAIRYAWEHINRIPMPPGLNPIYYRTGKTAEAHEALRTKRRARKARAAA